MSVPFICSQGNWSVEFKACLYYHFMLFQTIFSELLKIVNSAPIEMENFSSEWQPLRACPCRGKQVKSEKQAVVDANSLITFPHFPAAFSPSSIPSWTNHSPSNLSGPPHPTTDQWPWFLPFCSSSPDYFHQTGENMSHAHCHVW